MNSLTITNFPNFVCDSSCYPKVSVKINEAVRAEMRSRQSLTNRTALKILTKIKKKSDIKGLLTSGDTLFAFGLLSLGTGLILITISSPFVLPLTITIIGIALSIIGSLIFALLIQSALSSTNPLSSISQAYKDQSAKIGEYMSKIKKAQTRCQELTFRV